MFMKDAYFLVYLHRLFCHTYLKRLSSAHVQVLVQAQHWPMDAAIMHCSMLPYAKHLYS